MKNSNTIKNFDEVFEFLSKDPETIILQLKKDRVFIEKWMKAFVKEKPLVFTSVSWDPTEEKYPKWTNSLLDLTSKICKHCKIFTNSRCNDSTEKENCLKAYKEFVKLHLSRTGSGDMMENKILKMIESSIKGNNPKVISPYQKFDTFLEQRKFDISKLMKRSEEQEKSGTKNSNKYSKIDHDKKKFIVGFPIFNVELEKSSEYYEDKYNEILRTFSEKKIKLDYDKIHKSVFNYVGLYYHFFWDYLNKLILRGGISCYDVQKKTDKTPLYVAIDKIENLAMDESSEEVEAQANQVQLSDYDPYFEQSHKYLFESESLPIEKIFKLAKIIDKLTSHKKLKSIVTQDFPVEVKKLIKDLVGKKDFLRTPKTYDGKGAVKYQNTKPIYLQRHLKFLVYSQFFRFIYSILRSDFRRSDPKIAKKEAKELCKILQKDGDKNITDISKKLEIDYQRLTRFLKKQIIDHPRYMARLEQENGFYKRLIHISTNLENNEWIEKIYSESSK